MKSSRLTNEQREEICTLYLEGLPSKQIAARFIQSGVNLTPDWIRKIAERAGYPPQPKTPADTTQIIEIEPDIHKAVSSIIKWYTRE